MSWPLSSAHLVAVIALSGVAACDTSGGVRTVFRGDYDFTAAERRTITRIAGDAAREARQHLPTLAKEITLAVQSGTKVIPELGAIGEVAPPDFIVWTVDAGRPEGVVKIAEDYLRIALLHEFHHLVRLTAVPGNTVMDQVIYEGMATAFERDFGSWTPPWGQYPAEAASWVETLLALPSDDQRNAWIDSQPNGGRWIKYRAGTYLVDQAMAKLGKTSAELVSTPAAEIVSARPQ